MAATSVLFKGALTGPSPVDRARTGSKHHLLTDSSGIPLAISLTGGHRNDVTQLLPLIDGVGPVRGKVGRPRRRAERLLADRGYDHDKYRRELWKRGVKPVIARRATEHGSGLGRERWVVERTFAHLHNLRRLRTRYERDDQLHLAFMLLGCAVVCQRRLRGLVRRQTRGHTGRGSSPSPRSPRAGGAAVPRPTPDADRPSLPAPGNGAPS